MSNNRSRNTPSVALLALLLIVAGGWGVSSSDNDSSSSDNSDDGENQQGPQGTCFDGIDNDGDGGVDSDDPDCEETAPWYDGNENGDY